MSGPLVFLRRWLDRRPVLRLLPMAFVTLVVCVQQAATVHALGHVAERAAAQAAASCPGGQDKGDRPACGKCFEFAQLADLAVGLPAIAPAPLPVAECTLALALAPQPALVLAPRSRGPPPVL